MIFRYINLEFFSFLISEEPGDAVIGKSISDTSSQFSCVGSLTLITALKFRENPESGSRGGMDPLLELKSMKTVKLKGKLYKNLTRRVLTNDRKLIHVESNGNCCWGFFHEDLNFRGFRESLPRGFFGLPRREPKSVKQISCDLGHQENTTKKYKQ
jgi:hypothetical protein